MLWGKLIDHDRCIGCHACSVACKSENQVPLGSFRTWVKQVEKGAGLAVRRHFGVLRCNQCEHAPCVAICPTGAMHRRPDGIVDIEGEACIGCKACLQACPYDAITIDPVTHTADKCHFCAHRVEIGLQPACVAACPTDALVVSDLEDAESPVSRALAQAGVVVRKPELGTQPKVFYKGADQSVLDPRAALRVSEGYWGASRSCPPEAQPEALAPYAGLSAPGAAKVAYDVPRAPAPWGVKISAYLLSKAVGAGAMILGGLALCTRPTPLVQETFGVVPPLLAIVAFALTLGFLVWDLRRPDRFLLLLLRPQSKSWLVKGSYVLMAALALCAVWGLCVLYARPPDWVWTALGLAAIVSGAAAAGYTALLFGQAKGRQYWQSPLLLPHLVVQACLAGAAALSLWPGLLQHGLSDELFRGRLLTLGVIIGIALALNALMILGELWTHGNEDARIAARWLTSGERATTLYLGVFALGHVFPATALAFAFLAPGAPVAAVSVAGVAALAGVFLWDHLYVEAGQVPPLS